MATGDSLETAKIIAVSLELLNPVSVDKHCINGKEFEKMEKAQQLFVLTNFLNDQSSLIFYRLEPKHKQLLVKLLSELNQIVAMTGDGVNDAPALKQADIGIAMGRTGTEVAKEASDMILSDDNFSSIVTAIEEGRSIYNNMKAFIRYMISSNIGEVICIFIGSILGIPDIFSSVQLLWVNLVTDGLPAMSLSFNPAEPDLMLKKPRSKFEPLVDKYVFLRYMIIGLYVGFATVGVFIYWYVFYDWSDYEHEVIDFSKLKNWKTCSDWEGFRPVYPFDNLGSDFCAYFSLGKKKASTLSLTVLVVIEMFNSMNALSDNNSLLDVGLFSNIWLILAISASLIMHAGILYIPALKMVFETEGLSPHDWMLVIGFSWPVILIDETIKLIIRNKVNSASKLNCCKND